MSDAERVPSGRLGRWAGFAGLALLLVFFFAVNILAGGLLRSARMDLTENRMYTLSSGARSIAGKLDEPITLKLYYSAEQAQGVPIIQSHAKQVRELLEEFARASRGKIRLEVLSPEPFSEQEEQAADAGLTPQASRGGDPLFLGLVGTNSVDGREVIPFFDPAEERFLEYEVSRLIYTLNTPTKKKIGLISPLPLDGMQMDPMTGRPTPGQKWQVLEQAQQLFEVQSLGASVATIPADVSVLWVVHPKALDAGTLYAIDQFVLSGKPALVFVDPLCEADPGADPSNPMSRFTAVRNSSVPGLFKAWGVEMDDTKVAADRTTAIRVDVGGQQGRPEPVDYVCWMGLGPEQMNADEPIARGLTLVNMASSGILRAAEGASTTFTPLLRTSVESMAIDAEPLKFMPDPKKLQAEFVAGGTALTLAARVTGPASSAFPEGRPAPANPDEPPPADLPAHVSSSAGPISLVVVGDVDVLSDRFWTQPVGRNMVVKIANNADFLLGAIDALGGGSELVSIRPRGRFTRPFDRVQALQKQADAKFLAQQQALEASMRETQTRLTELQKQRPTGEGPQPLLTPEQIAEIEKLQSQYADTRTQLRAVQHDLGKDIKRLGTRLALMNTAAVPALVAAFAIGLGGYRVARRRAERSRA